MPGPAPVGSPSGLLRERAPLLILPNRDPRVRRVSDLWLDEEFHHPSGIVVQIGPVPAAHSPEALTVTEYGFLLSPVQTLADPGPPRVPGAVLPPTAGMLFRGVGRDAPIVAAAGPRRSLDGAGSVGEPHSIAASAAADIVVHLHRLVVTDLATGLSVEKRWGRLGVVSIHAQGFDPASTYNDWAGAVQRCGRELQWRPWNEAANVARGARHRAIARSAIELRRTLTQREVADRLGISVKTVQRMEKEHGSRKKLPA